MKTKITILTAMVLALSAPLGFAQVPQIINYQGKINVGATPFTGSGQFKFALVNGDGSTSFWSHDGTSTAGSEPSSPVTLPVANGLYVVPLGDTAIPNMQSVPATVFTNSDVRLRVWFNDGTNGSQLLAPDQRITSVGYAMVAGTVPDGAIGIPQLAPAARPKHDRQMAAITTSDPFLNPTGSYVDVPGLTISTRNLGETGTYHISFQSSLRAQNGFGSYYFVINVDGSDMEASRVFVNPQNNGSYQSISCTAMVSGIASGKVVKLRCNASGGACLLYRPTLVIDGVPSSQVVP